MGDALAASGAGVDIFIVLGSTYLKNSSLMLEPGKVDHSGDFY